MKAKVKETGEVIEERCEFLAVAAMYALAKANR